ncbi:P-loop containing nucleoside triphosphate hydrolase protein [Gymnopilus junonius]|uniref:P-loop containing nucleoside triphosphate hydrolase protein n=1 Tax=Gymnopilus junonius TaxID=109634 RepID=A0A9P5TUR1_GYMJU|nr:P-loop containing nucleoside triphosphate hydrolase protein [Gymnopilus junonius]
MKNNSTHVSVDDLLRRREERPKKRRRVSELNPPVSDASSGSEIAEGGEQDFLDNGSESNSGVESIGEVGVEDNLISSKLDVEDRLQSFSRRTQRKSQQVVPQSTGLPQGPSFASLGISLSLLAALKTMSIKVPTEVQAACIPALLAGKQDCIGNAKTGSGKTIAFALPILQRLSVDPYGIFALVLTPTRELAFQIAEQFAVLGSPLNVRTAVIVGGMDMMAQALELGNRPHIVVATPGRIVDHLRSSSGEWDLSRVKFLVLDEADRLLTSTFSPELSYLFNTLPKQRQTCLFTATLTPAIENLAEAPPRPDKQKPFVYRMRETIETVSTLKQHYILVPSHVRESYLYYLLCNPPESTIHLRQAPPEPVKSGKSFIKTLMIRSTALHSRLTQRERLSSLSLFRASVVPVLVSTDVGARGLDIEDVAVVINWDLPNEPEEYTHRVGRTARAGKGGMAISLVTERDEERVLEIENRIKTKLEEMTVPEDKVLDKLNTVSTAKRLANMELHDSNFGKREEIHKIKQATRGEVGEV